MDDAKTIRSHALIPVTTDEMQLELEKGTEALFDSFDKHGITEPLNVDCKSTKHSSLLWLNFFRKR